MENYKKQPANLKALCVDGKTHHFEMNVSKKRMVELLQDTATDVSKSCKKTPTINSWYQPIVIETNSVWYDKNGVCFLSDED